ncbi:hypothetical protein L596_013327 [Steinernema carpocapsae]|uniref:Uncharacterized protein n=1 Tax=Steinernema carpocapsae TaxID=34508 RepID=A0A4U5NZT3_STECR|nr:hypothetical protein L596_013327 [Steinernema carpocapsae]
MTSYVTQTRAGLDLVRKQVDSHMDRVQQVIDQAEAMPAELRKKIELCTDKIAALTPSRVKSLESLKTMWKKKFNDYEKAVKALPEDAEATSEDEEWKTRSSDFAMRMTELEMLIFQANEYVNDWNEKLAQFRSAQVADQDANLTNMTMNQTGLANLSTSFAERVMVHLFQSSTGIQSNGQIGLRYTTRSFTVNL